ncbi:MAG TPA: anti-sigma factor [Solirubrobacteraceae bacterium]|jgi:anti-sigma factor RsiW
MSPADRHQDEWADAVGAYLLEALPEDERAAFEAHLEGCTTCQEDVAMLRVASDALPASVQQLAPPPELKGRIMAVVRAEADLLAAASGPRADLPERARDRGWLGWLTARPGLAAAGVALLLLVGGVSGAVMSGGEDGRVVTASVAREVAENATAKLVIHKTDSKLEVTRMPPPQQGRVYQVWLKRAGVKEYEPTSALFVPRAGGDGSVSVPGSLKGVEQVLVTSEPAGGSSTPTRDPVITADTA